MRYRVLGTVTVPVNVLVEAESEAAAIEAARSQWPGLNCSVSDGLPGRDENRLAPGTEVYIESDCQEAEFDEANVEEK